MTAAAATGIRSSAERRTPEERLVDALISLMEAGTTPWRRPWDVSTGGHHVNLLSGRRYRGGNPVLLSFGMQLRGSSLPYWCGFAEARARGLTPRRGSHAVHVLRPQLMQPREESSGAGLQHANPDQTAGTRSQEASAAASDMRADDSAPGPSRMLYRPVPVFNAADLQGEGLADLIRARRSTAAAEQRPATERLLRAEALLQQWPVPVISGGDQACYSIDADRIHLPDRAAFHSAAAHLATWAHEAIHSTGHPSRLGRDLSGVMESGDPRGLAYAREELVAELGAVLLGDRLEIGSDTCNHAAYLTHWIALLRESPRLLLKLLSEARQAAELICPEATHPAVLPEPPPAAAGPMHGSHAHHIDRR